MQSKEAAARAGLAAATVQYTPARKALRYLAMAAACALAVAAGALLRRLFRRLSLGLPVVGRLSGAPDEAGEGYEPMTVRGREVTVCTHTRSAAQAARELVADAAADGGLLGMDCEWPPEHSDGGATLLQLASARRVVLFRLCHMAVVPAELRSLLADPAVFKAAVNVNSDCRQLVRACPSLNLQGMVCISEAAAGLQVAERGRGLAALASELLSVKLPKPSSVRLGDWIAPRLSPEQVEYAALDAVISLEVTEEMLRRAAEAVKRPYSRAALAPFVRAVERAAGPPAGAAPGSAANRSAPMMNVFPRRGNAAVRSAPALPGLGNSSAANRSSGARIRSVAVQQPVAWRRRTATADAPAAAPSDLPAADDPARRSAGPAPAPRITKPDTLTRMPYDDCVLLTPDGADLVSSSRGKAMWYVSKDLAEVIQEDPLRVRLKFEPRGREAVDMKGADDNRWGTFGVAADSWAGCPKPHCVCCGAEGIEAGLLRHHVVPHCVRREFPARWKDNNPDDVVLLRKECAQKCYAPYERLRKRLFEEYNVPDEDSERCRAWGQAVLAGNALLQGARGAARRDGRELRGSDVVTAEASLLPPDRVADLVPRVTAVLPDAAPETLSVSAVQGLVRQGRFPPEVPPPWRALVQNAMQRHGEDEGVRTLVRSWRRCFVDSLSPQFLPPRWSVDKVDCIVRDSPREQAGAAAPRAAGPRAGPRAPAEPRQGARAGQPPQPQPEPRAQGAAAAAPRQEPKAGAAGEQGRPRQEGPKQERKGLLEQRAGPKAGGPE